MLHSSVRALTVATGLVLAAAAGVVAAQTGGVVATEYSSVSIAPGPVPDLVLFASGECMGKVEPCG